MVNFTGFTILSYRRASLPHFPHTPSLQLPTVIVVFNMFCTYIVIAFTLRIELPTQEIVLLIVLFLLSLVIDYAAYKIPYF
jgi:hypothetical protein